MKKKLPQSHRMKVTKPKSEHFDTLLEEYMSKLEQKIVSQTHQFKTITDNATSCLFMIDKKGKTSFMNPAAEKVTGYTLEEIKEQILYKLPHKHTESMSKKRNTCSLLGALRKKQQIKDQEDVFVRKDGSIFPISFSLAPLYQDGKQDGAVLEFQDITKRKELERQKDDFIGVASHELKTPVTSMKTYTQVLIKQFEKKGDLLSAAYLIKIDTQINKLTALITDLLDVTRTRIGKLNLKQEKFAIEALVREVVEDIQLTTQKHLIVIKGYSNARITADRDRTSQVLINLLSNAIKYSPKSGKIVVHIKSDKKEVTIGVQDFGIGIPQDKLTNVFDRFMRVKSPQMETFAGLGLGLYIASDIVRRQGGRIWATSKKNAGSTFYFSLPIKL